MIIPSNYQTYINTYSSLASAENSATTHKGAGIDQTTDSVFSTFDTVTLGNTVEASPTYAPPTPTNGASGDNFDLFQGLVLNILKEQGINYKISNGDTQIDLSKITQADAQKLIAEDGYFGVDQTSDRIVNFAKSIAGGDPAKIEAIKAGVDNGFQEALKAFGGTLPDISHDTYDAVMNKLDAWVQLADNSQVTQPTG